MAEDPNADGDDPRTDALPAATATPAGSSEVAIETEADRTWDISDWFKIS